MTWEDLKSRVENQTSDVMGMLRDYEKNDRQKVLVSHSGKLIRTEIHIDFDLSLYIYQDKDGFIKRSYYTCFSHNPNLSYRRDIH